MSKRHGPSLFAAALLFLQIAPGSFGQSPQVRDQLTADSLFQGDVAQIVHNRYFMAIGDQGTSSHQLSGTLHFSETRMTTTHRDSDWRGSGQNLFPAFSVRVMDHEGHLIPLDRGIIYSGEKLASFYNIIVSPGRVWQEPVDNGYSRASFPFTLTSNVLGEAWNGLATFVFNNLEISNVAVQIAQETVPSELDVQTEFHAVIPIRFDGGVFPEAERVVGDFRRELDEQLPVRPWSEVGAAWEDFNPDFERSEVSAAVLVMDGVLYMSPVETRAAGPYPYPGRMRHGVYSVTKTLAMGLSMFHMAERYGEQVFDLHITDYVPQLADHPGWNAVTFEHALNMATGTYAEDQGPEAVPFIVARSASEKLRVINGLPDDQGAPGEVFDYASSNTFTLSYALNQYVKSREGPEADFWLMVRDGVLRPLRIPHLPVARTAESGGRLGTPIMGWGSYPNVHEAAKIAQLLQDDGAYRGRQLLNRSKVREALYKTSNRGLVAGTISRYLHSVWLFPMENEGCQIDVPYMAGWGGNYVAMIPSGISVFRFADVHSPVLSSMVRVAERYKSSCQ